MANVSKLIFGAAIAAASIVSPALAAHHKGKPIFAHQNVTRSSHGRGVYGFAPVQRSGDPAAEPYDRTTPFSAGGN